MKIKIYYEDTDTQGIVYHANYLKFCDRARSEFFNNISSEFCSNDEYFVVRDCKCRYFAPAKLFDELLVKSKIVFIGGASFRLEQNIFKDEVKIYEQTITLAFISFGKLSHLKPKMLEKLHLGVEF